MEKQNNHQGWNGKTGGGHIGQFLLLRVLAKVKVTYLYPILYLIIPFYILFDRKIFANIFFYHKHIRGLSAKQARKATWKNYILFGQVVLDKFALLAGNTKQFQIDIHGNNLVNQFIAEDKGGLIIGGHIGNFELAGYIFQQKKKKFYILSYEGEGAYYQHKRTNAMKDSNIDFVQVKSDMSHLFTIKQVIEAQQFLLMTADRINGSLKYYTLDFFNQKANFPIGPFQLAYTFNYPLIVLFVVKEQHTKYSAYLYQIDKQANTKDYCIKYIELLENILQKYPTQWFNFFPFWNEQLKNNDK
ncbi:MAG: hypothetical protein J5606_08670 [Bacteroidales bacterium]|nr:hypothetical protein [Bacteroidales bacterium]